MTQQLDFSTVYFLLEAFNRLGVRLYGDEWTGLEAWARPTKPPDEIRSRRRAVTDRLKEIDSELALLIRDFNYAGDRDDRGRIGAERRPLESEHTKLDTALRALPNLSDSYLSDHAAFVRREKAEETLWEAVGESKFKFQYGTGPNIDWRAWRAEPGFKVYLSLSMATTPPQLTGARRMPVIVGRVAFDNWLDEVTPVNASPDSPEIREMEFIAYLKSETMANPNRLRKIDFQRIAKEEFGIGTGQFRRLWDAHASKSQQRPGRRPNAD